MIKNIRKPAFAGSFYSANHKQLRQDISQFIEDDGEKPGNHAHVRGLILPHAGYIYSGEIAGSGYRKLSNQSAPANIFLLGSSHRHYYKGAAVYNQSGFQTPFGLAKINTSMANDIIASNLLFSTNEDAHTKEHSLEVQVPFLQQIYGDSLSIVPVLVGTDKKSECRSIAESLKPYFTPDNLFIVSTDFSHYPSYEKALAVDKETVEWVAKGSPDKFFRNIMNSKEEHIPGVLTRMCGWSATLILMYLAKNEPNLKFSVIRYANSGDIEFGDRSRVVGYFSMSLA